jgi:hypothetical protein
MLFVGLWRWYINITITILDIIHRPVFHLRHDDFGTWFCLRLKVEPTEMGPVGRANVYVWIIVFQRKDGRIDNVQICDSLFRYIKTQQILIHKQLHKDRQQSEHPSI